MITYDGNPKEHLTNKARGLFRAYTFLKDYKIWPVNEGWTGQSAKFIKVIEVVDMIRQRYNEIEQTESEARARQK